MGHISFWPNVDDFNVDIVRSNTDITKQNAGILLDASKKVDLEFNPEKTKIMLMSCYQEVEQKHSIKTANRSFECIASLKYFGTALTDQNCLHGQIKSRLNSGNACYHSVESFIFPPAVHERKV
jgi:hypothetical protein